MNTRIRICHLQLLPLMTGVQRAMVELLKRLDPSRFEHWVVCKNPGPLTEELAKMGVNVLFVPSLVRRIHPLRDLQAFIALYRLCKHYRFRIVHTHSSKTGALGRLAARAAGADLVFHTVQGLPFHEFSRRGERFLYGLAERLAGLCADRVIFVNEEERQLAIRQRLISPARACTIYNGVDLALVERANTEEARVSFRRTWGIPQEAFVVGYVGRLWAQKDPTTLAAIIDQCSGLPVHFVIAGDGPYQAFLAMRFAGQRRVTMTGWLPDPTAVYPAIDVLLLPSLWEGLPMTLIEAMAFGKPLVASNVKGNRECVRPGHNGLLCTPRIPEEFVRAIETLRGNRHLYQEMKENCLHMSRELFDVEANAGAVIRLYEEAYEHLGQSSPTARRA